MIQHRVPGLDLYSADPVQPLTTAGEELDDLHDLYDLYDLYDLRSCLKIMIISPPRYSDTFA